MSARLSVLYVCTANVSRSPYAQYRTAQLFGRQLLCGSAGIPGTEGRAMDPAMEAELPFEDEAALTHRSRPVARELVERYDVVLTMEFLHHMRLIERWPDLRDRVFGLRQFVHAVRSVGAVGSARDVVETARRDAAPNSIVWDIADPYRRGSRAARDCARQLDRLVAELGTGLGYEREADDEAGG